MGFAADIRGMEPPAEAEALLFLRQSGGWWQSSAVSDIPQKPGKILKSNLSLSRREFRLFVWTVPLVYDAGNTNQSESCSGPGVNPALVLPDIPILNFPEQIQILPTQIQVLPALQVITPGLGFPKGR